MRLKRLASPLPVDPGASFLVNRVRRGLEHFRVRKSSSEVATILASQSEIDATAVDSSYTLLKVFIWAIPILGFIGTVIGISAAVSGFSGSLEAAEDIAVLKGALNNVTRWVDETGDKRTAYADVYWVLINSAEFLVNH